MPENNFVAAITSQLRHQVADTGWAAAQRQAPAHVEPSYRNFEPSVIYAKEENGVGLNFALALHILNEGGELSIYDDRVEVVNADAVTILLSAAVLNATISPHCRFRR